jgi:hypothetical protein
MTSPSHCGGNDPLCMECQRGVTRYYKYVQYILRTCNGVLRRLRFVVAGDEKGMVAIGLSSDTGTLDKANRFWVVGYQHPILGPEDARRG